MEHRGKLHEEDWQSNNGSLDEYHCFLIFSCISTYQLVAMRKSHTSGSQSYKITPFRHGSVSHVYIPFFLTYHCEWQSKKHNDEHQHELQGERPYWLQTSKQTFWRENCSCQHSFFQLLLISGLLAQWWHSLKVTLVSRALIGNPAHRCWWICLKHED